MIDDIRFSIKDRTHKEIRVEAQGKLLSALTPDDLQDVAFGDDFDGEFVLRYPTIKDTFVISKKQHAELMQDSVVPVESLPPTVVGQAFSFAVYDVLGKSAPEWFSRESPATRLLSLAILEVGRAYDEAVNAKKKQPAETHESQS